MSKFKARQNRLQVYKSENNMARGEITLFTVNDIVLNEMIVLQQW